MALGKVKWSNKPGPGKPSPLAIRTQGLTSKSERAPEGPQVPNASRKSAQALATVAPVTPALTGVGTSLGDAVAEASPPATAIVSDVPTGGGQPNGRPRSMSAWPKSRKFCATRACISLRSAALAAEWLHHAEAKLSVVVGQHGEKSAGRPEGALTRAARELCVPGSTPTARRKFMERALKIDSIRPEAQSAARNPPDSITFSPRFSALLRGVRLKLNWRKSRRSRLARRCHAANLPPAVGEKRPPSGES